MKIMTISAVVLGLAMSGAAIADDHGQRERGQRGWGHGLELTAEQREQMREIRTEYAPQMRALREEMQARMNEVLTPEQQAQVAERREAMRARMQQRGERGQRGERHHRRGGRSGGS